MDNNFNPTPSVLPPAPKDNSNKLPLIAIVVSIISLLLGLSGLAIGLVASGQFNRLQHENELLKTYLEVDTESLEAYANGEYEEVDIDEGDTIDTTNTTDTNTTNNTEE